MTPYLQDADFTLYNGDAREVLAELPAESVHMCVTSPPFFGLRDYGVANQIGLEITPEAWVEALVAVFEQVRRVLRKDGTLWIECGDSYGANTQGSPKPEAPTKGNVFGEVPNAWGGSQATPIRHPAKPKDLIGQPFLLAFALREAGWYWRNVCIWHKPNPMPESVRDRFTVSHSYVLLFSKSPRYFFDAEAVREDAEFGRRAWSDTNGNLASVGGGRGSATVSGGDPSAGRNARSVWTIPTEPLPFEHYAAFPQALAERCIKAGSPLGGMVLDPFCGSGTTPLVARRLGRHCIGVELNERYCELAAERTQQLSLTAEVVA